ncbi:MAG TPA: DUF3999 family protein [Verrucomicrobiae bacterium]|jgi:hypothetical protein|nr:DUF3999 family protein [Verrucomicrobiae bacterium]
MKSIGTKSLLAFVAMAIFAGASANYFKYQRPMQVSGAAQHYVVVDDGIWGHARADLGDLRIFNGPTELPYATTTERGSLHTESQNVRVLQPGKVGGKTQFVLDMAGMAEYDHIYVQLATTNFVGHARAEGNDDLHGARWTDLGGTIFYDLSNDSLGHNSTLRLPLTTYKYLRVTIDGSVAPADIQAASAAVREEEKAVWRDAGQLEGQTQQGKDTVLTFKFAPGVPVERLSFSIDPAQPNFRRTVEIQGETTRLLGSQTQTHTQTAELSRIHMVRYGQKIDSEQSAIDLYGTLPNTFKVVIHNGDDLPLKITSVHLQQYERRVYFDLNAQSSAGPVMLYYGDDKLGSPEYDYAKLFQRDIHAIAAQLGPVASNAAYTPRPDDRPWSEQHPGLLWGAIIAAVVVLGAIAIRSLRTTAAQPPN